MRSIPSDFDPSVVASIESRLGDIAQEQGVAIPWAVESGSRAWGFPSPDSDYDCRFFFLRRRQAYVDPWPPRDVIETPLDGLLDVNGWDTRKAVKLAVLGNATVGEWLRSPWVYRGEEEFRAALLDLVSSVTDPIRLRRHYLHVGRAQWLRSGSANGEVQLKRVFYAVRPAATLEWLDAHTGVPPMNLDDLIAEAPLSDAVTGEIAELRDQKSRTRELGSALVPAALATWVETVFAREDERLVEPSPERRDLARAGFLALLDRWAPNDG